MYRERWFPCNDAAVGEPMYQVFCMQGTPPATLEEQDRCMHSKSGCWRVEAAKEAASQRTSSKKSAAGSTSSSATG
jgi:hypothetical protein